MKDKKRNATWLAYIAITVALMIITGIIMWICFPHRDKDFKDGPEGWVHVNLIRDPVTYSENRPYIDDFWVDADTDRKMVSLNFRVVSDTDLSIPMKRITLRVGDIEKKVYEAPFDQKKEIENEFDAYLENVKDGSRVYTVSKGEKTDNILLHIICPMEETLKDPGSYSDILVGLAGIFDENGNEIISDKCSTDWIVQANRNGRIVPEEPYLNINTIELEGMKEGDTVRIYLSIWRDGVEFCSPEDLNKKGNYITEYLKFDGFDADPTWELKKDERGWEMLVLVLNNVRDIKSNEISISFPAGIASGWDRGIHCCSQGITVSMDIRKPEDRDEYKD